MKFIALLPMFLALAANASHLSKTNYLASPHQNKDGIRRFDRPFTSIIELRRKGTFARHCGMAQLSAEWYLIPAECMNHGRTDFMRILELDFDNNVHGSLVIWLEQKVHPQYNEKTKENNIALIKGNHHKQPTPTDALPQLPSKNQKLLNAPAFVYGYMNWPHTESLTMTTIETKVINPLWCQLAYPSRFKKEKQVCVSGSGFKRLSQADIGAPLVITNSENVQELVGLFATDIQPFTNMLAMPMVFDKLEPYVEWIMKETNGTLKIN